jgi:hypothetical protein
MNDTTFKLRVPTSELKDWKERATAGGLSLLAWIRANCAKKKYDRLLARDMVGETKTVKAISKGGGSEALGVAGSER